MLYIKIPNSVGRNDNFLAKARKLSILRPSLDIFYIRQHYIRILYLTSIFSFSHNVFYPLKSKSKYLTFYHTIPTLRKRVWKTLGKKRKCWLPAFSLFPSVFYSIIDRIGHFSMFNLSSTSAFSLTRARILSLARVEKKKS